MNTFALILCLIAIVLFLAHTVKRTRHAWQLPLGLAFFAAAFAIQLVFNSGPAITH